MLTKISGNNPQSRQRDSHSSSRKSPNQRNQLLLEEMQDEGQNQGQPEFPLKMTLDHIKNIIGQLNQAEFYRKKNISFHLRNKELGPHLEIHIGSVIYPLNREQLLELWVHFKVHPTTPPKGGLLNILC